MCNGGLRCLYVQDLPKLQLCQLWELAAAVLAHQCDHAAADMVMAVLGLRWLGVSGGTPSASLTSDLLLCLFRSVSSTLSAFTPVPPVCRLLARRYQLHLHLLTLCGLLM